MIRIYTCPICNNKYRVIVDHKTNIEIPSTRCPYNGCPSYHIQEPSDSPDYIKNIVDKYTELVGKFYRLSADGTGYEVETIIDVQGDGSVILVDRVEYLPLRLTAKQFEVYRKAAQLLNNN